MNNAQIIPATGEKGVVNFKIRINGQELPTAVPVYGLIINKEVNRIPYANLLIVDGDPALQNFEMSSQEWFIPGNEIELIMGYLNGETLVFKGVIVKQQISIRNKVSLLELTCRDTAYRMTLRRQGKYFENYTDAELSRELLNAYGISSNIADTSPRHPDLVQHDCTDWDFMVSRMECNGLLVMMEDGVARIQKPDFDQEPVLHLHHGATVIEFDGTLEARDQYEQVAVRYWDAQEQAIQEIFAKEPAVKQNGNLPGLSLASANGTSPNIWRQGSRSNDAEMQAWVDARLLKDRLSRTCGRVQFQGFNAIKPGQIVVLHGFGQRFDGPVFVAAVHQEYLDVGWLSEIEFGLSAKWFTQIVQTEALPAAGMLPSVSGLQIGIVTQIEDDPDGMDRIRVRVPMLDAESVGIWARVATFDAGAKRGAFFRPEINDEVVLGFVHDDPRNVIVLGMLHSSLKPAPFRASAENHEKGFVSRNGIQISLNENDGSLTLLTPQKNKLNFSDKDGNILLEDQHGNRIEMNANGIALKSKTAVVIDAQSNCTISAKVQLKAESSANIQVRAGGIAEIKGSIVNIN